MEFQWVNYQRSDPKILKAEDNYLYQKGAKGRPGSNTQYMRCASQTCSGTGKFKVDQPNSFQILWQHNHNSRLYAFEAKLVFSSRALAMILHTLVHQP